MNNKYSMETVNVLLATANECLELYRKDRSSGVATTIGALVGLIERGGYKVKYTDCGFKLDHGDGKS